MARKLLERVAGIANDVGLLAEELHVSHGRLLGNFRRRSRISPSSTRPLGLSGKVCSAAAEDVQALSERPSKPSAAAASPKPMRRLATLCRPENISRLSFRSRAVNRPLAP